MELDNQNTLAMDTGKTLRDKPPTVLAKTARRQGITQLNNKQVKTITGKMPKKSSFSKSF